MKKAPLTLPYKQTHHQSIGTTKEYTNIAEIYYAQRLIFVSRGKRASTHKLERGFKDLPLYITGVAAGGRDLRQTLERLSSAGIGSSALIKARCDVAASAAAVLPGIHDPSSVLPSDKPSL